MCHSFLCFISTVVGVWAWVLVWPDGPCVGFLGWPSEGKVCWDRGQDNWQLWQRQTKREYVSPSSMPREELERDDSCEIFQECTTAKTHLRRCLLGLNVSSNLNYVVDPGDLVAGSVSQNDPRFQPGAWQFTEGILKLWQAESLKMCNPENGLVGDI